MAASRLVTEATSRLYAAYGTAIESDLPLPALPPLAEGWPKVVVRHLRNAWPAAPRELVHELADADDAVVYRVERQGARYLWSYPAIGRFAVARDGRLIEWVVESAPRSDAAAAVSGPVLGFALQLQGMTSLHGSATAVDGEAVALLGPSGYGKSTVAAALLAHGAELLTDDVLAIDFLEGRPQALPSYPSMKLWPDALGRLLSGDGWQTLPRHASWLDKRVVPASEVGAVCPEARPLGAIFVLVPTVPESEPAPQPFEGKDALLALVAHGYNAQLLALEPELLANQLDVYRRVAECVPVFALACPRTFDRLNEVVEIVLAQTRRKADP